MLYLHGKLRVAPLHIIALRTLKRGPRRGKTFKLCEKLSAFITVKSDECRSSIAQTNAVIVSQQGSKCSGLGVAISPHHYKSGFCEALGL